MSTRKGCGAPIEWVKMAYTQKMMPVDATPIRIWAKAGGSMTVVNPNREVIRWEPEPVDGSRSMFCWVPHWQTCPQADQFRRKGGR